MRSKILPILILILVWGLVVVTNLHPGTWLSGWDNLHPEFNFALNIQRSFFAVWQEYQGLGLLGGMAHASDLPRQLFLWVLSLAIPTMYLRVSFHFLMFLLGGLGMVFFLQDVVLKSVPEKTRTWGSLVGSIFYLFNLATIQAFTVPFEPFSVHFAAIPWLFWANLRFLHSRTKTTFLTLVIINILAVPQAYVETIFLVYFLALSLVSLTYFLIHKFSRDVLKSLGIIFLVLFIVNAFWLLPNLYFVLTQVGVTASAKINLMATEDNLLQSQKYGTLDNIALLKSFWFDNYAYFQGKYQPILETWSTFLRQIWPAVLSFGLFGLALFGLGKSLLKKELTAIVFLPPFILAIVVLATNVPGLSLLSTLFYRLPLFSEIFRTGFTKVSLLLVFVMSIFITYAYVSLAGRNAIRFALVTIVLMFLPLAVSFPVFRGHLFAPTEQVKQPSGYQQLFQYLNTQPAEGRIANFPQNTFWGWTTYRWGYTGSGFLWYGIKQPVLDRAFDPWNKANENYYWEISYALYSKNQTLLESLLEKYQIKWLLVDESIINPPSPKAVFTDELESLLGASSKISLDQTFGSIKLYKVNLDTPVNRFVFAANNLPTVGPKADSLDFDQAFSDLGHYISGDLSPDYFYPFRSLFTGSAAENRGFAYKRGQEVFFLGGSLPSKYLTSNYQIKPVLNENQLSVLDDLRTYSANSSVVATFPLTSEKVFLPDTTTNQELVAPCGRGGDQGKVSTKLINDGKQDWLEFESRSSGSCLAYYLPDLWSQNGYIITVQSQNLSGRPLLFWLENVTNRKADIETYLDTGAGEKTTVFIEPPMAPDGLGYVLHFNNISVGTETALNRLGKVTVSPLPVRALTGLRFEAKNINSAAPSYVTNFNVSHPNESLYFVALDANKPQTIILSQAFNPDWLALSWGQNGLSFPPHLLINNWENGWQLRGDETKVYIFFVPQLLEFAGFGILFLLIILVAIYQIKKPIVSFAPSSPLTP